MDFRHICETKYSRTVWKFIWASGSWNDLPKGEVSLNFFFGHSLIRSRHRLAQWHQLCCNIWYIVDISWFFLSSGITFDWLCWYENYMNMLVRPTYVINSCNIAWNLSPVTEQVVCVCVCPCVGVRVWVGVHARLHAHSRVQFHARNMEGSMGSESTLPSESVDTLQL